MIEGAGRLLGDPRDHQEALKQIYALRARLARGRTPFPGKFTDPGPDCWGPRADESYRKSTCLAAAILFASFQRLARSSLYALQ